MKEIVGARIGTTINLMDLEPIMPLKSPCIIHYPSYTSRGLNMKTIGTCDKCGGPVQVPAMWGSTIPPTPKCSRCGAVAANDFGPIIPMAPPYQQMPPTNAISKMAKQEG